MCASDLSLHTVNIENRSKMTVSGVLQVIAYDEYKLILKTDFGKLVIQGKNLIAGEISSSQGVLKLTGDIEVVQYLAKKKKNENFFAKLSK